MISKWSHMEAKVALCLLQDPPTPSVGLTFCSVKNYGDWNLSQVIMMDAQ